MFRLFKKNKDIELSVRQVLQPIAMGPVGPIHTFLAYRKSGHLWKGLVGYEQFRSEMFELEERLDTLERLVNKPKKAAPKKKAKPVEKKKRGRPRKTK